MPLQDAEIMPLVTSATNVQVLELTSTLGLCAALCRRRAADERGNAATQSYHTGRAAAYLSSPSPLPHDAALAAARAALAQETAKLLRPDDVRGEIRATFDAGRVDSLLTLREAVAHGAAMALLESEREEAAGVRAMRTLMCERLVRINHGIADAAAARLLALHDVRAAAARARREGGRGGGGRHRGQQGRR